MASTDSLAQCPYCGQPIGKVELEKIKQRASVNHCLAAETKAGGAKTSLSFKATAPS